MKIKIGDFCSRSDSGYVHTDRSKSFFRWWFHDTFFIIISLTSSSSFALRVFFFLFSCFPFDCLVLSILAASDSHRHFDERTRKKRMFSLDIHIFFWTNTNHTSAREKENIYMYIVQRSTLYRWQFYLRFPFSTLTITFYLSTTLQIRSYFGFSSVVYYIFRMYRQIRSACYFVSHKTKNRHKHSVYCTHK